MTSKPSKSERKEERIQRLEKELDKTKKRLACAETKVYLDEKQLDDFMDKLTERIEWSTNRIVDETKPTPDFVNVQPKQDAFSTLLKYILAIQFSGFGIGVIAAIVTNWGTYWTGGTRNLATLCVIFVGICCCAIGIDIFSEKDRDYLVALFSALVALVALIVALVKW